MSKPALYWKNTQSRRDDGYRSGLEAKAAKQLEEASVPFEYEKHKLPYVIPSREASYTYDFLLNGRIIVETKGLFDVQDRQKMVLIKQQYPDLDIRLVFSNAYSKLYKNSPTTYAKWAEDHGFPWAHKTIPPEWLEEAKMNIAIEAGMIPCQKRILSHLEKNGSISQAEATTVYRETRLAARIHELKGYGYPIEAKWKTDNTGKRYKRYYMNRG